MAPLGLGSPAANDTGIFSKEFTINHRSCHNARGLIAQRKAPNTFFAVKPLLRPLGMIN